jgi:phosphatidate cytidylyltransferase
MKRILTAAVLIPIVVWTVLYAPHAVLLAVLALVGIGAYLEYDAIAAGHGLTPGGWLAIAAGIAFLVTPQFATPLLILAAVVLITVRLGAANLAQVLPSASASVLGILYIFGAWHCAILLRQVNPHWLMIALLVSWAGDTAAMYVGRAWGKRKLAPRVSPGKTQEGAIASVVGGTLAAVLYAHYFLPTEPMFLVIAAGATANAAGQLGDLCESAFKRGAGVKDSGTILPGHGGLLDRIDSSLFSVPAIYAVLLLRQ